MDSSSSESPGRNSWWKPWKKVWNNKVILKVWWASLLQPGEEYQEITRISSQPAKIYPKIDPKNHHQLQSCSWQWSSPWWLSFHCWYCLDQTLGWRRLSDCLPSVDASTISFSLFSWPQCFPERCLPVSLRWCHCLWLRLALAHFGQIPFIPLRITWDDTKWLLWRPQKTLATHFWQTSFAAQNVLGMSISQSRCSVNEASHFPAREILLWLAKL